VIAAAKQSGAANLPFILSEYNPGLGIQIADEPYTAAFISHTALALSDPTNNIVAYSFWTFSDIFEEGGQNPNPFYDGFGLETIYNIAKPVYRAFQLLHGLGTHRLAVSTSDTTTAEVLSTYEKMDSTYSLLHLLVSNYDYKDQPITNQSVTITLSNVPSQLGASADIRRIDDTHANALPVWKNAGSPTYPNASLIKQMDTASQLIVEQIPVTSLGGGQYSISLTLPPYGVADIAINVPSG